MSDPTDFSLDDAGHGPVGVGAVVEGAAADPGGARPPAVIVVEYRKGGLAARLLPPVLILLAALVIISSRRPTPPRSLATRPAPTARPTAPGTGSGAPIVVHADGPKLPTPTETPPPVSPPTPAAPAPVSEAVPAPAAAPAASPFEIVADDGLRPLEPVPVNPYAAPAVGMTDEARPSPRPSGGNAADLPAAEAPAAEPIPSKDAILEEIRQEADQVDARRQEKADLKSRASALVANESMARTQADRIPFRNDLRTALKISGPQAGVEIERLCNQYGRQITPALEKAYLTAMRAPRLNQEDKVRIMRALGMPEPVILDTICHSVHKQIGTRGGPRNEDEVFVRAAGLLLRYPVYPSRKPDSASASATTPAAPAAPRPGETRRP